MDVAELIQAHRNGHLGTRQLLIPEMDQLSRRMRNALTFEITPNTGTSFARPAHRLKPG